MVRHLFSGGNTRFGFKNLFDTVIPQDEGQRILYLKGSSGSGKSTLVRKIGSGLEARGHGVEYIHCSFDANSLDGLYSHDIKLAILDGTAPHVGEPYLPGASGEVINLGEYIRGGIKQHRSELEAILAEKKRWVENAYHLLKAAHYTEQNNDLIYKRVLNQRRLSEGVIEELKIFRGRKSGTAYKGRDIFASAITPAGVVSFADTLLNTTDIIALDDDAGYASRLLAHMRAEACLRGIYTESCYCGFDPEKLEHLIIPELDVSFTTRNAHHQTNLKPVRIMACADFADAKKLDAYRGEITHNQGLCQNLLDEAVSALKQAKIEHEKVEAIYFDYMDFSGLDRLCETIQKRI